MDLRPAARSDLPILSAMLREAALWREPDPHPSSAEVTADPALVRYVKGWGRAGDFGIVAEQDGRSIGAVWARCFTADAPGYGFIAPTVPELSLAVAAAHRGEGVGTALLRALLLEAHGRGIECLSLSVERDNPSVALYERFGFVRSHSVGNAWTMVVEPGRTTR